MSFAGVLVAGALVGAVAIGAPTARAASGYATTLSTSTQVDPSGTVHATVRCAVMGSAPSGAGCPVTLTLSVIETLRHGRVVSIAAARATPAGRSRATMTDGEELVVLARRRLTVGADRTAKVTLALDRTGRELLASHANLKVRYIVLLGASGSTHVLTFHSPVGTESIDR